MLKTLTVALFAVGMSVGVANATHAHKPMMAGCAEGQQATATCLCGTGAGARPINLRQGAMVPLYGARLREIKSKAWVVRAYDDPFSSSLFGAQ